MIFPQPGTLYEIADFFDGLADNGLEIVPGSVRWVGHPAGGERLVPAVAVRKDEGGRLKADPLPEFKANNEAAWAAVFDALGVAWRYETIDPDTSRAIYYVPDFWLPEYQVWIEIKSKAPTPGEIRVARQLLEMEGCPVYVLAGWPGKGRYKVYLFHPAGEVQTQRPDWCDLALCSLFDVHFSELRKAFGDVRKAYRIQKMG